MIAYAAPSSHVRLKRLYGTPIVSGRCGGTEIDSRGAVTQNRFCHRSLKDNAPSTKPEAFDPGRGRGHEHTAPQ